MDTVYFLSVSRVSVSLPTEHHQVHNITQLLICSSQSHLLHKPLLARTWFPLSLPQSDCCSECNVNIVHPHMLSSLDCEVILTCIKDSTWWIAFSEFPISTHFHHFSKKKHVDVILGRSWKPTVFRMACNDLNYFQLRKHLRRWSYDENFPLLLRSEAEFVLNDLFLDGQACKDWPSAMHDHMSISFNISLRRWLLQSIALYNHFAGFSLSVLLPTNEQASIFSRACRQSRLIMCCHFRVGRAHGGLAPGVSLFTEPG